MTDALSYAIVKVAQEEFERLSRGLTSSQKAHQIGNALTELEKLSRGTGIPDYNNPWVALFYVTWYQPRQINIAYSMLKSYLDLNRMNDRDKLFVVDFGCGALAMQFGTALAFSDAAEHGKPIPNEISILSLDSSKEMIDIGCKIWEEFKESIQTGDHPGWLIQLKYLAWTLPDNRNQMKPIAELLDKRGWKFWVSAIHTVYRENQNEVRDWLGFLSDSFRPDAGFITSFQGSRFYAYESSPFEISNRYEGLRADINPVFKGYLPKITRWRNEVHTTIQNVMLTNLHYLKNSVGWNRNLDYRDINFLIYGKTDDRELPW